MGIYDITLPVREAHPPWPGDAPYKLEAVSEIKRGERCNVSRMEMSTHFATHLDAPYHFIERGAKVHELSLDALVGPALVWEVDTPDLIYPHHLPSLEKIERILFKTSNGRINQDREFHTQYVSLSGEAARELTRAEMVLAGIDYFSMEAYKSPGHPVHMELCGKGVIVVEGLDLEAIPPGMYELTVLPLKLEGADGSPCRAILRDLS